MKPVVSLSSLAVTLAAALCAAASAQSISTATYSPEPQTAGALLPVADAGSVPLPANLILPATLAIASDSFSSSSHSNRVAADVVDASDAVDASDSVDAADEAPEAPEPSPRAASVSRGGALPAGYGNPAFRRLAIALKAGDQGIGFEVAVPLMRRINLRSGVQFLNYNGALSSDGVDINAQLKMLNASASIDLYPFRNSFHISPGITMHNDTHVVAALFAPPGNTLSLGNDDYVSDPSNPISGTASVKLGNSVAPRITVGWGNMVRGSGRFSFPIELGIQYISAPVVAISLMGNGCDSEGCGEINKNGGAADIQAEITRYTKDLSPLRFYPIFSIGVGYRFGGGSRERIR